MAAAAAAAAAGTGHPISVDCRINFATCQSGSTSLLSCRRSQAAFKRRMAMERRCNCYDFQQALAVHQLAAMSLLKAQQAEERAQSCSEPPLFKQLDNCTINVSQGDRVAGLCKRAKRTSSGRPMLRALGGACRCGRLQLFGLVIHEREISSYARCREYALQVTTCIRLLQASTLYFVATASRRRRRQARAPDVKRFRAVGRGGAPIDGLLDQCAARG